MYPTVVNQRPPEPPFGDQVVATTRHHLTPETQASSKGLTVCICATETDTFLSLIFSILIALANSFETYVDVTHFPAGSMMTLIQTYLIPLYVTRCSMVTARQHRTCGNCHTHPRFPLPCPIFPMFSGEIPFVLPHFPPFLHSAMMRWETCPIEAHPKPVQWSCVQWIIHAP